VATLMRLWEGIYLLRQIHFVLGFLSHLWTPSIPLRYLSHISIVAYHKLMNSTEFLLSVRRVVSEVKFNNDFVVSTFETNIRMLGGLLGAHSALREMKGRIKHLTLSAEPLSILKSYKKQLLSMAVDLVCKTFLFTSQQFSSFSHEGRPSHVGV
jgi:hypothetical protein